MQEPDILKTYLAKAQELDTALEEELRSLEAEAAALVPETSHGKI